MRLIPKLFTLLAFVVIVASCAVDPTASEAAAVTEAETQLQGYEGLAARQPAEAMDYSPTRETINAWVRTWDQPGQLAFTYILNFDGDAIGYYVLEGPPVSYCASLTPTYQWHHVDLGAENGYVTTPAPSLDGVFYSGGQCIQYFGIDASTGALLEFTAGGSLNFVNSTQPLPNWIDIPALGHTNITDVTPNADGEYIND